MTRRVLQTGEAANAGWSRVARACALAGVIGCVWVVGDTGRADTPAHGESAAPSTGPAPKMTAEAAKADLRQAITYASYLFESWQFDEGKKLAEYVFNRWPEEPAALGLRAYSLFLHGEYDEAVKLVERVEHLDPEHRAGLGDTSELIRRTAKVTRGFVKVRSPKGYFEVATQKGKDELVTLYALEILDKVYETVSTDYGFKPPTPVRVEIYPHLRNLADVTTLTVEDLKKSGTIALCKYNRLMATTPRVLPRGYAWADTLSHEFVHHVVGMKTYNRTPIWLQEGFARFLEETWRGTGPTRQTAYGGGLLNWALRDPVARLVTFEQMHPSMAKLPSQDKAALAFAEVHMAIAFVYAKKGRDGVQAVMNNLRDGLSDKEAVAKVMGMPFTQFEMAWRDFAKTQTLPPALTPDDLPTVFNAALRVASGKPEDHEEGNADEVHDVEAAQAIRLGELLLGRGRKKAALAEYDRAVRRLKRPDPIVHVKYGKLLYDLGRLPEAEKTMLAVREVHPDVLAAHLTLGRIAWKSGRVKEAIERYEEANLLNPFHPEIHGALAELFAKPEAGPGAEALRAREVKALRLLSGEGDREIKTYDAIELAEGRAMISIYGPLRTRVLIDGQDIGRELPLVDYELAAGDHVVSLVGENDKAPRPFNLTTPAGKRVVVSE